MENHNHTEMSWKHDNLISQLHNSVDNVTAAVGQALSHPTEQLIQHALTMIDRAENALTNALQNIQHQEPIHQLEEQLNLNKKELERLYTH
ncbi:hypothetical protein [Jeotgalibacillus soli]|uniref:Uncharacterized protein n=1 Tax=Jeotgalibacillus soli TaxID=889306 RepID=A0A0C2RTY4_9BACL|nr:hypothetical protein [Jeotgalibacillus soli]KIL45209.1 hypothetical protein KP78_27530 [Jeotgalibacillus soli]